MRVWFSSLLRLPFTPIAMSPSAVTPKAILIVLSSRMNGSSPPAAARTVARMVSIASTRTGPMSLSRSSGRSVGAGGTKLISISCVSCRVSLPPSLISVPISGI